jgi:hypothetical protein
LCLLEKVSVALINECAQGLFKAELEYIVLVKLFVYRTFFCSASQDLIHSEHFEKCSAAHFSRAWELRLPPELMVMCPPQWINVPGQPGQNISKTLSQPSQA